MFFSYAGTLWGPRVRYLFTPSHARFLFQDWTFAEDGRMRKRQMSGNDVPITNEERWFTEDVADEDTVDISEKRW